MLEIKYEESRCVAVIHAAAPLTTLVTAVQSCSEWFLTHGINCFSILRQKNPNSDCVIRVDSINQSMRTALFSSCTPMENLVDEGYFPENIRQENRWQANQPANFSLGKIEGSKRINGNVESNGQIVVPIYKITRSTPVTGYAFGIIAEPSLPFFMMGAHLVKHQGSIAVAENQYDVALSESQMKKFMADMGYNINTTVSQLPV